MLTNKVVKNWLYLLLLGPNGLWYEAFTSCHTKIHLEAYHFLLVTVKMQVLI